jgi:TonB family protein
MRAYLAAIALAAASPAFAAPSPAPGIAPATSPAASAPAAPAPDPILAYYPAAARAADLEGQADLRCDRDAHLKLANCTLVSESPAGQGFGAAAIAIAAQAVGNPAIQLDDPAKRPTVTFTMRFALKPEPSITPNVLSAPHTVVQPTIAQTPTPADFQRAYPARALDDGVAGAALLDCLVSKAGALTACRIFRETPPGYGFGAAALEVAKNYVMRPRLIDGAPVDDAEVQLPVSFSPADPTAPLTLGAPPAH